MPLLTATGAFGLGKRCWSFQAGVLLNSVIYAVSVPSIPHATVTDNKCKKTRKDRNQLAHMIHLSTTGPSGTRAHTQPFNGLSSGTTRVGRFQKKHSPTHTMRHPLSTSSIYTSSLFNFCAWQSFSTISLQVLFGLPLSFGPCTSSCMHFFTQSSSSFRNTCPYQHSSLFCCNTNAVSSIPNLSVSVF